MKRESGKQSFTYESAVKYLHVVRRNIQISPPLGEQDQSNPHPMPISMGSVGVQQALQSNELCCMQVWPIEREIELTYTNFQRKNVMFAA